MKIEDLKPYWEAELLSVARFMQYCDEFRVFPREEKVDLLNFEFI